MCDKALDCIVDFLSCIKKDKTSIHLKYTINGFKKYYWFSKLQQEKCINCVYLYYVINICDFLSYNKKDKTSVYSMNVMNSSICYKVSNSKVDVLS